MDGLEEIVPINSLPEIIFLEGYKHGIQLHLLFSGDLDHAF